MNLIERLRAFRKEESEIRNLAGLSKLTRKIYSERKIFFVPKQDADNEGWKIEPSFIKVYENLYEDGHVVLSFQIDYYHEDYCQEHSSDERISVPADLIENFTEEGYKLFKAKFVHERGERILKSIQDLENQIKNLKLKLKKKAP
jgi:hypothetical protein